MSEELTLPKKESWPKNFFDFAPIEDTQDFKLLRKELKSTINEDPLA